MIQFKKVKILGVSWSVLQPEQSELGAMAGVANAVGLCDDMDERIYVAKGAEYRPERRIFVHEWAHAVSAVNGLNQTLDDRTAEIVSQSFANALLELLEQPEVVRFLTRKK